jgi:hypothetical protein
LFNASKADCFWLKSVSAFGISSAFCLFITFPIFSFSKIYFMTFSFFSCCSAV